LLKDNQNLLWQTSSGPISGLKEYILKEDEHCISIGEEEAFAQNNENILLISAEPGMGKSLILDNFTQNSTKDHFFIKIILNTCKEAFKNNFDEKLKNANFSALDFILKDLLQKKDSLEINVLKYLVSKEKLVLMFDGLDEVLSESINQLIGIPLQTKMLADIFIDSKEKDFSKLDILPICMMRL